MTDDTPVRPPTLERGDPDDPTVVLLPPAGGSRYTWRPHADRLADEFHVVSADLPGHGHHPDDRFEMRPAIRSTLRLLAETGPAVVVGYSLGGYVGCHVARNAPDAVEGLGLVGAAHDWTTPRMRLLGAAYSTVVPGALGLVATSDWAADRLRDRLTADDPDGPQTPDEESPHDPLRRFASTVAAADSFRPTWASVAQYGGPLLVVHGGEEWNGDHARRLARREDASLVFVEGADHQDLGDRWDEVTGAVRGFAGRVTG